MISVNEISRMNDKKNKLKKETYYKIFEQVSRRIRVAVDFRAKMVIFIIPGFIIGCPIFDRHMATVYIRRQLENRGFDVNLSGDYQLHITWKLQKSSPAATVPPPRGGGYGYDNGDGDDFPSLINLKKVANKMRADAGKR
jgi:hypothetical protein